ncbi:hypothetical protein C2W62_11135, partial [Candidatus Entotheonella serta]
MSNQSEAPALANIDQLMRGVSASVGRILDKALSNQEVSPEEAVTLFDTQGLDLMALMATADALRQRQVGDRVTYVKVRNINFTNVCYTACKFCEFGRQERGSDCLYTPFEPPTILRVYILWAPVTQQQKPIQN